MQLNKVQDWSELHTSKKNILNGVVSAWESMLVKHLNEKDYHEFLKNHAGFFFSDFNCYLTISKLKLGSELETDFINIRDNRSNGITYEFIEIEKPGSKLFTKNGVPAKDFNNAIQQIRDWKRFLIENKNWFRKYLPSQTTRVLNNAGVNFTIIIGRRNGDLTEIEKRNQIADEIGVQIRSFDYLTDLLKRQEFINYANLGIEGGSWYENQIENPFYKAISDSKWRQFCSKNFSYTHFYMHNCESILKLREYNVLFQKFLRK